MADHPKSSEAYDEGPYGTIRSGRGEMEQHEHPIATGAGPIEPGMLVERTGEGGDVHVQAASANGTPLTNTYIAVEARGRGMNALDGEYVEGEDEFVRYKDVSGGGLNLLLAAGESVDIGAPLVPDGNGYLRESTTDADGNYDELDAVVAEAGAAVDNSGGNGPVFVPAEVN